MLSAGAVNWLPFPVALKMSTFFSFGFFLNCTYLYILYFTGLLQKLWIPSSCYTCGLKWVLYVSSDKQEIIEIFPFKYKLRISSLKGDFCVTTIKMSYYWVLMTQWRFLFCVVVPLPREDERGSSAMAQLQPYATSSTQFSPVHFDHPGPSHSEADDVASHC